MVFISLAEEQSLREIKEICYGEGLFFKNGHYERMSWALRKQP